MTKLQFLRRLARDERGATVVEYGLAVAMIFLAIAGVVTGLGTETTLMWNDVSTDVSTASSAARGSV